MRRSVTFEGDGRWRFAVPLLALLSAASALTWGGVAMAGPPTLKPKSAPVSAPATPATPGASTSVAPRVPSNPDSPETDSSTTITSSSSQGPGGGLQRAGGSPRIPSNPDSPGTDSSTTITSSSSAGPAGGLQAAGGPPRALGGGITQVNGSRVDMGILESGWADISGYGFGDTSGVVSVLRPYRRHTAPGVSLPPETLLVLNVVSWSNDHIRVQISQPIPASVRRLAVPSASLFYTIPNLVLDVAVPTADGDVHYRTSPFSVGVSKSINLNGVNNPP